MGLVFFMLRRFFRMAATIQGNIGSGAGLLQGLGPPPKQFTSSELSIERAKYRPTLPAVLAGGCKAERALPRPIWRQLQGAAAPALKRFELLLATAGFVSQHLKLGQAAPPPPPLPQPRRQHRSLLAVFPPAGPHAVREGESRDCCGNHELICGLFPHLCGTSNGHPPLKMVHLTAAAPAGPAQDGEPGRPLQLGVVLSGGQAAGGDWWGGGWIGRGRGTAG